MVKITRYLDPTTEGGTGSQAGAGSNDPGAGAAGGADPKAAEAAVAEAEQKELTSLLEKDETALSADEKTKLNTLKEKYEVEELDDEGKPLSKEKKEELQKVTKRLSEIKAKPEAQRTLEEAKFLEDNTEKQVSVYEKVDELSGKPVEVDYKDVDPTTPEGILLREEAIREQATTSYDDELKDKHPIAYQLMLHEQAGGKVEDFFKTQADDFSSITITKTDVATQESVYRKALALKGNTPDAIDILVTAAKDKGKLLDLSKSELEALQKKQEETENQRAATARANKQKEVALTNTFFTNVDKMLQGKIQGISIPKGEHKAFTDFVAGNVILDNGRLLYARVLDPNNLMEELAANYFRYKKGDLSKIVETKAKDLNTQKIKGRITYKITPKSGATQTKHFVPLGEL